jgi:hypothetical protein
MRLIDADALRRRKELRFSLMAAITTIQFLIDEAPTVEERKQGHWLTKKAWHVECSECHHVLEFICDVKKYCPNCGAKMENNGDDDDE